MLCAPLACDALIAPEGIFQERDDAVPSPDTYHTHHPYYTADAYHSTEPYTAPQEYNYDIPVSYDADDGMTAFVAHVPESTTSIPYSSAYRSEYYSSNNNNYYDNSTNSNLSSPGAVPPPQYEEAVTTTAANTRIDYSKFKTKLCRYYIKGMVCPFLDNCAFAHGEEQLGNAVSNINNNNTPSTNGENLSKSVNVPVPPAVAGALPPSYDDVVLGGSINNTSNNTQNNHHNYYSSNIMNATITNSSCSDEGSRTVSPPPYPTSPTTAQRLPFGARRFRYNPYTNNSLPLKIVP